MGMTRQSLSRGPGTVKIGTTTFYDKDNISAELLLEQFDIPVSAFGKVDTRKKDQSAKITFKPCGEVTSALLALLFPYTTPNIGASLFGVADTPAEVHSKAGTKLTFHCAAITAMPELILSATETLLGQVEITALIKNGVDPESANSLYTIAAAEWAAQAMASSNIKTVPYSASWNGLTFKSKAGFTVAPTIETTAEYVDGLGTIDMTLTGAAVTAKCRPIGLSEADIAEAMALQGPGNAIGTSLRTGADLTITGAGGLTVILRDTALVTGPFLWGTTELRAGEIGFIANRTETTGAYGELFSVAMA